MQNIVIKGARSHNLKNIDVTIPRDKLVVITGLSGSGKSTLAFDTIFAEGQRRYVESLSAYARQFLTRMERPDVDHIEGLSPAISIEQKTTSHNPRSTVGTITEIHDYLRLLFARAGVPICPKHKNSLEGKSASEIVEDLYNKYQEDESLIILTPLIKSRKGEHKNIIEDIKIRGFVRLRINNTIHNISDLPKIDPKKNNTIELVIDRLKINEMKCPYCRNIGNKYLPFYKYYGVNYIRGVNGPTNFTMNLNKCEYIVKNKQTKMIRKIKLLSY